MPRSSIGLYCAGTDLHHHRLTLDVAGGRRMPPTLIQAGGAEMLRADARALDADIRTAGGTCELQVWPDQVHVFQALPTADTRGRPAMRRRQPSSHRRCTTTTIDRAAG